MLTAQQLKSKAKAYAFDHELSVQEVLVNYMFERILFRISLSEYADRIILKGGLLISSLFGFGNRSTLDMDANIRNISIESQSLLDMLTKIVRTDASDNICFEILGFEKIRKEDEYGGVRIKLVGNLENIKINLSIDFSTGDIITPNPILIPYPQLFEPSSLMILAYPIESILAEKLHAILDKNGLKGRMKDYFDLHYFVSKHMTSIQPSTLKKAVTNTFDHRQSMFLLDQSVEILHTISMSSLLQKRWTDFSGKHKYAQNIDFSETIISVEVLISMVNSAD